MVLRKIAKKRCANIVIKDHVIRYIEIRSSSPINIRQHGERELPTGIINEGNIIDKEAFAMILDECVEEWKIKGLDVNFIVPDSFIVLRQKEVPNELRDDEIAGHLYLELGTSIHLPFEDPVFDVHLLEPSSDGKKNVLLFAAPEQVVLDYVEVFENVKLNPVVADISPLSIYRLYANLDLANPNDHLMIIQLDTPMINVSLFHDHKPLFMRHILIDVDYTLWRKNEEGVLEWAGDQSELIGQMEDIYTELDRMMNFYRFSLQQGNAEINRILLTGDNPGFQQTYERLSQMYEIKIDTMDDIELVDADGQKVSRHFHLALGLAMREVN